MKIAAHCLSNLIPLLIFVCISKWFELQQRAWWQMKALELQFLMLFLFFESDYFEGNYALLSISVRIFMSKIVLQFLSKQRRGSSRWPKIGRYCRSDLYAPASYFLLRQFFEHHFARLSKKQGRSPFKSRARDTTSHYAKKK